MNVDRPAGKEHWSEQWDADKCECSEDEPDVVCEECFAELVRANAPRPGDSFTHRGRYWHKLFARPTVEYTEAFVNDLGIRIPPARDEIRRGKVTTTFLDDTGEG